MIICVCHRISESDIAAATKAGCDSFEALQRQTGVGTQCGVCVPYAREALEQQRNTLQAGTADRGSDSAGALLAKFSAAESETTTTPGRTGS